MSEGSSSKLTKMDALAYVNKVEDEFHDEKEKLDEFFKVMKDYNAQRLVWWL